MENFLLIAAGGVLLLLLITVLPRFLLRRRLARWEPLINDDDRLAAALEEVRVRCRQPALGVALVRGERVLCQALSGTALAGSEQPLAPGARFHIGSTTKPVTALLLAVLVKEGLLDFRMSLAEALPGIPMRAAYRRATLHELLLSRAGVLPLHSPEHEDPQAVRSLLESIPAAVADPHAQRLAMAQYVLDLAPIVPPGTRSVYSNPGWSLAGLAAELATGRSYEALLEERVLAPLGMTTARLGGWPASDTAPDEPRGHYPGTAEAGPRAQALDDAYVLPAWMNPAGGLSCSLADYAAFARENLLGLAGRGRLLDRAGYETLHKAHLTVRLREMYLHGKARGRLALGYGWGVVPIGGTTLSAADGSGGTFYARLVVFPALDVAFAGFTNAGDGNRALDEAIRATTGFAWG